jgi:hypothetical protein
LLLFMGACSKAIIRPPAAAAAVRPNAGRAHCASRDSHVPPDRGRIRNKSGGGPCVCDRRREVVILCAGI